MKWSTQFPCPEHTYSLQAGSGWLQDYAPCTPEAFCPSGPPKPVPCPWGTYNHTPKAEQEVGCALCSAGHQCPKPGIIKPQPCNTGSFSGTFREAPGAARVEDCQLCLPGAFCGKAGLAKPQGLCHPGHYCGPGSSTATPEGRPFGNLCPPGHFCPAGTKDPRQWPCPAGTWNAEKGAQDLSWCLPCPPGLFCAAAGQAAPRGPCAPGFHCPGGALTPRPLGGPWRHLGRPLVAMSNLNREHRNGTGAEAVHPDEEAHATTGGPCPVGHFCPVGTGMPLPCPVGTFSDRMFLSKASECLSCPPGHFCAASGLITPSGLCAPGYFCLVGASSPTPTGLSERGGPCPRGHFCPWGTSLPQPCLSGSYSTLPGQASCFTCPAGYYCPENMTDYREHPCPAGFYCPPGTKYATQFPCPRGYYNPDSLTHSLDSCLPCPPGHYCGQENLTKASGPCDAGWFCVLAAWTARPFDLDNYTSTNCLCPATATGGKCPAGSYCPMGSPEPTPCPPGSFCATSGLSIPSGPCQAGYFCAGGSMSPAPEDDITGAPCPPGSFCSKYLL
ncbi:neurogenic locus notch homolog protein 4-like [Fukomys damarensis]|uniref:neurogenic locus notch homolog protein 4-like n=1 Tax=Fukomys damarensis TaxID=885580 RepID=UPI00053FEB0E|nr:neurogenic locus notch homolog protein 4-like [Fukomys damarensis]